MFSLPPVHVPPMPGRGDQDEASLVIDAIKHTIGAYPDAMSRESQKLLAPSRAWIARKAFHGLEDALVVTIRNSVQISLR